MFSARPIPNARGMARPAESCVKDLGRPGYSATPAVQRLVEHDLSEETIGQITGAEDDSP